MGSRVAGAMIGLFGVAFGGMGVFFVTQSLKDGAPWIFTLVGAVFALIGAGVAVAGLIQVVMGDPGPRSGGSGAARVQRRDAPAGVCPGCGSRERTSEVRCAHCGGAL